MFLEAMQVCCLLEAQIFVNLNKNVLTFISLKYFSSLSKLQSTFLPRFLFFSSSNLKKYRILQYFISTKKLFESEFRLKKCETSSVKPPLKINQRKPRKSVKIKEDITQESWEFPGWHPALTLGNAPRNPNF